MIAIQFVKMGDFYEAFGTEARIVAKTCGLVLTKRRSDGEDACGIPAWSSEERFAELRAGGFLVSVK